jgi:uncharacterized integral membrane protein
MGLFRKRPEGPLEDWQPRLYAMLIGFVLIVAWLIAFIAKNNDSVKIDFVIFAGHASLIWLMILLLAIGFLGGVVLSQVYRRRRQLRGGARQDRGADG